MPGARQETRAEPVISRVIDALREQVFEAFTQVRELSRWWGPEGFTKLRNVAAYVAELTRNGTTPKGAEG